MLDRLSNVYRSIRSARAEHAFARSCALGEGVQFGPHAACVNEGAHESISIGAGSFIDCTLMAKGHGRIVIGEKCWIGGGSSTRIGAAAEIQIGSFAIISNNVRIYDNNNHPTSPGRRLKMSQGEFFSSLWSWDQAEASRIRIEENVWVGEYSAILKGVSIGQGSIVAAHAVVTKDVPSYSIVAGNPARIVKHLEG